MNTTEHQNPARSGASGQVWGRPFCKAYRTWCDDFVVELRLMDVSGDVIGERLAEVEAHCAESGETPHEAFGEPNAYAKTVGAESPKKPAGDVWGTAVLSMIQVLVLLVGTRAAGAWVAGEQLQYNAVQVVCLTVAAAVVVLLPLALRLIVHRPALVGLPYIAGFTALSLGTALAGRLNLPVLITTPAAPVTVGMFVITLVLGWVSYRNLSTSPDPVTSPLINGDQVGGAARGAKTSGERMMALCIGSVLPVAYVFLSAASWLSA